ncbi:hypothetical protein HK103_002922 [Boothiomyces macroporosus]|uniref:HMG box domain-containing protein n=1 Tax=Boothiomyces macroporosus TaxID=261099 RepID=A0AAD5U9E0_9FUNG|nr:hypothetical protein HK103_002922 [Boothiomyces macroporosus]
MPKDCKLKPLKKPLNCFFRYKKDMRDIIISKYGVSKNSDVARIAADLWAKEDPAVIERYTTESERAYKEHREKYPDYIWPSKGYNVKSKNSQFANQLDPAAINARIFSQASNIFNPKVQKTKPALTINIPKIPEIKLDEIKTGWTPTLEDMPLLLDYKSQNSSQSDSTSFDTTLEALNCSYIKYNNVNEIFW